MANKKHYYKIINNLKTVTGLSAINKIIGVRKERKALAVLLEESFTNTGMLDLMQRALRRYCGLRTDLSSEYAWRNWINN